MAHHLLLDGSLDFQAQPADGPQPTQYATIKEANIMNSQPTTLAKGAALLAAIAMPSPLLATQIPTAELIALPTVSSAVDDIYSISGDDTGSWVASATTNGIGGTPNVIYGVLAGSGTSTPAILRTAQMIGDVAQTELTSPRVRGDNVAYAALSQLPFSPLDASVWVNDTLIARTGDPIGGALEWVSPNRILLTGGDTFVQGLGRPAGSQDPLSDVIARYPSGTVVYSGLTNLPEFSGTVQEVFGLATSPSGNHWTATVVYISDATQQFESAVLLDGAVFRAGSQSTPLTTELTGFGSLHRAFVDDSGVVTVSVQNSGSPLGLFRSDSFLPLQESDDFLLESDALGRLLTSNTDDYGIGASIDGVFLDRVGAGGVDATGDGTADAGWAIASGTSSSFFQFRDAATFIDQGQVLVIRRVQVPGVGVEPGVLRATHALPDVSICSGAANSTGLSATMRVLGSDIVSFNDLELLVTNIPRGSAVLPIFSRTSGFTANPGGSGGNLCLGGAVGRGFAAASSFPDLNLNLTFVAFPSQLPQPTGPVAAQSGETWYFQAWYRDDQASGGSNFTNAVSVTFQ